MSDDEGDWSDVERAALARLKASAAAPDGIEARIVSQLRSRGLLHAPSHRFRQWAVAAAVVVLAFAAGALVNRATPRGESPDIRFMLLLYGGTDGDSRRTEYAAWAQSVADKGINISGAELSPVAEELPAGAAAMLPTDAQPRGYFIVAAATLQEARRIAGTCPHLKHGGRIVIRGIVGK